MYSILIVLMASPAAASSCPATHNLRAAPRACFLQVIILLLTFSHSFNQSVERLVVNPLKVGGVAPCAVYCAPRITLQLFRSHAQRIITSLRESAAVILEKVNASQLLEEAEEKHDGTNDEELEATLETDLLEVMVKKLAILVTHAVPGNNRRYVDQMNVDSDTAEWLTKNYLTDKDSGEEITHKRFVPAKMRIKDSRTSVLQKKSGGKEKVNDWNLDPTALEPEDMLTFITFMFDEFNILEEFDVSDDIFMNFLKVISSKYVDGPTYHNWIHGFDVTHTMYRFITLSRCHEIFGSVEIYATLIATIAHDVGHPGVNNNYLIATKHSLAIVHNDLSPLENMHCATLYDVLRMEARAPRRQGLSPTVCDMRAPLSYACRMSTCLRTSRMVNGEMRANASSG